MPGRVLKMVTVTKARSAGVLAGVSCEHINIMILSSLYTTPSFQHMYGHIALSPLPKNPLRMS